MGMPAVFPVIDNARVFSFMAVNTFPADLGHAAINSQVANCA